MTYERTYTHEGWRAEATRLFGPNPRHWKFKCVNCGHVQSGADFEQLKVEEWNNKVYFSCIGRWIPGCTGVLGSKVGPCNYTLGGLFILSRVAVLNEDGKPVPVFEFAE